MKEEWYESNISNGRWIAYDLPGNVGWIIYLVCLIKRLQLGGTVFSILAVIPALLMIVGIVELAIERIQKLDRVLPKIRLYRGFGALVLGGVLGMVISALGLIGFGEGRLALWMLAGAALCALFAWLIFREYHRREAS
ncbi:MAG: hypothetical protein IJV41_11940 [Oscillospiraceae bacterium]|nr:hypothetical protein [Oscillospiraceae bacterium]